MNTTHPPRRTFLAAPGGPRGHGVAELLVAVGVAAIVMAGLFATVEVAAKASARATAADAWPVDAGAAVERLVTDLRMAGSYYAGATNAAFPITAFSETAITFVGDVDGDGATTITAASIPASVTVASATGFSRNEFVFLASGSLREVARISSDPAHSRTLTLTTPLANTFPAGSLARSVERVTWAYDPLTRTLTRTDAAGTVPVTDGVVAFTLTGYDVNGATTVRLGAVDSIGIELAVPAGGGTRRTLKGRAQLRSLRVS
jgi:hypothetical protein